MPMLCPSIQIDKNKQGGRNFDASKLTDFKKIGTIVKADTSKTDANAKNRDPRTDLDEQRRAAVLISGLQTIPRALCNVCPGVSGSISINDIVLQPDIVTGLSQITFYVFRSISNDFPYFEINSDNILERVPASGSRVAVNNTIAGQDINRVGNVDSLSNIPLNATRQDVVNALNDVLSKGVSAGALNHSWASNDGLSRYKLVAGITPDGRLTLTVNNPAGLPPSGTKHVVGLAFGDAPNGSTALGATTGASAGVTGGALVISPGQTSITAPFRIGGN